MTTITSSTPLIKLGGEGQNNTYPVFLAQVRRENADWSFNDTPDIELINNLGYQVVSPTDKPVGDVVTEAQPFILEGAWFQAWTVRPFNEAELAAALERAKEDSIEAVNVRLADALGFGFPHAFDVEGGTEVGHVQLRNTDRSNLVGIGMKADRLIAKGVVGPVMPFRTFENVTYMCTPEHMKIVSDQAYDAYLIFIGMAWQLKDAVTNATVLSEIPAIPESLELPEGWDSAA